MIEEILGAVGPVTKLVDGILTRGDRDAADKEADEYVVRLQNSFPNLDSDDFRSLIDELYNKAGCPLTPSNDPDTARREFIHASLLLAIRLIHERRLTAKLIQKVVQ